MDFKTLVEQITTLFTALNKKQKTIIALSTMAVIGFVVFLVLYTSSNKNNDGYAVLFNKLSAADSALVIQQLEADNVPYKIVNENVIKVPKEDVYKERIVIASQGIPKSSKVGFELFDTQNFGETDFAQNIKYLRALEGELARTIEALTPIEDAKVHIALPKETVFVQKETLPTASVVLRTLPSMKLTSKQVTGIKNLISASVTKLMPANVKIIDQHGEPLDEASSDGFGEEVISAQIKYRKKFERALEEKINNILAPVLGGKAHLVAKVTADFNFEKKNTVDEYYDPESVVRSEQSSEEKKEGGKSEKKASGVPGAISNISPTEPLDKNAKKNREKYEKSTTTTNYEISKKITNIQGEFATLRRITAAVVVDGKYETNEDDPSKIDYISLDKTELSAIDSIVKRSIGYNEKRGDEVTVTNLQFKSNSGIQEAENIAETTAKYVNPLLPLLKYLVAGLLLFVFYKKIIKPFSEKMIQDFESAEESDEPFELHDIEEEKENNEALEKYNQAKEKIEAELGINNEMDEQTLKHTILLERMQIDINNNPEELAKLIQTILKN
ncbi:MAG TPA: flagellar M-ring protein FliF, partial [Campylobacterales bacterium]|nr:flagellar M-ring protein FliF [Campylobacterales bacterium]